MKTSGKKKLFGAGAAVALMIGASMPALAYDNDNNPPGRAGGPGTNWENPPGKKGGPGASPDRRHYDNDDNPPGRAGGPGTNWENPRGPAGGPGASPDRKVRVRNVEYSFRVYEGGYYFNPEFGYYHPTYGFWNSSKRCWFDNDNNPPGRAGGPGTNWENPPGIKGGPGASPDRYGKCR